MIYLFYDILTSVLEDILADTLLGMTIPFLINPYYEGIADIQAWSVAWAIIIINVFLSHLLYPFIKHKVFRITYGALLFVFYPVVFI